MFSETIETWHFEICDRFIFQHEKGSKKDAKPSPVELDLQRKVELLEEELNNKLKQNMKLVEQVSQCLLWKL